MPVSPTPDTPNRPSLQLSTAPRALRLVDQHSPSPHHTPKTASSPLSTPPQSARNPRPSSISYKSTDNEYDATLRSPPTSSLTRSLSLGRRSPRSPGLVEPDRQSSGSNTPERPPVTLAEKHAELLHFIAQKESKCLELRSQLAVHEAELLQLKRKWERIVSRKFDKANGINSDVYSGGGQGTAVLEGIKEGVQGVSRFVAAGLSIHSQQRTSSQSSSSASTSITKSTRHSESSATSFGDELIPHEESQVLMVHDTGATPTVSPNPVFMHQQQQGKKREKRHFELPADCLVANENQGNHRQKSCELVLPSSRPSPGPSTRSPPVEWKQTEAAKAVVDGSPFPSTSSKHHGPSWTPAGVNAPPVSSWIGSVGKKWEELQRGPTFSKGQKRASMILSDVSQTIASALSPSAAPPTSWPQTIEPRVPRSESPPRLPDVDDKPPGRVTTPRPGQAIGDQDNEDEEWNW